MNLPLPSDYWQRLQRSFCLLAEMSEHDRSKALNECLLTDPSLANRLRSLFEHDVSPSLLDECELTLSQVRLAVLVSQAKDGRYGEFVPLRLLGRGGAGTVFLAERGCGAEVRHVAIKAVLPEWEHVQELRVCLWRELAALRILDHPRIPRVIDCGQSNAGAPWIATEYIQGQSLIGYSNSHRLSIRERAVLFVGLLDALAHAHARAVFHGDLKDANVLVDSQANVHLIDFGASSVLCDGVMGRSVSGAIALTRATAAPEQIDGETPTARSDVYSAGLLLLRLLGREEHNDGEAGRRMANELTRSVRIPNAVANHDCEPLQRQEAIIASQECQLSVPGLLELIAIKATSPRPEFRYGNATEMRDDLLLCLAYRVPDDHIPA